MTTSKKFKRAVRERARHNGESYLAARQALETKRQNASDSAVAFAQTRHGGDNVFRFDGFDGNMAEWCAHHAFVIIEQMAGAVRLIASHPEDATPTGEELRRKIGHALYNATKVASLATGAEWQPDHAGAILEGRWPSLWDIYGYAPHRLPPNNVLAERVSNRAAAGAPAALRMSDRPFDMSPWLDEKVGNTLEGLSDLQHLLGGTDLPMGEALRTCTEAARASALALWNLVSAEPPPKGALEKRVQSKMDEAQHVAALMRRMGAPPGENRLSQMTELDMAVLLASVDDNADHHVLWVDKDGRVHLDPLDGAAPTEWAEVNDRHIAFRHETFVCGNGYCGMDAAQDLIHVRETLADLREAVDLGLDCGVVSRFR